MIFKATLDPTAKLITIGIAILIIGIILFPFFFNNYKFNLLSIFINLILIMVFVISYCFSPKSYEINAYSLLINRPFNTVIINKSNINYIQIIKKENLNWSVRTFGVGGLFGYFGFFWNKKLGNMIWYASKRDTAIMINTKDGKTIIITPDEVEKFISIYLQFATN